MAVRPGGARESFGSLLRGGAAEHAVLVALLAGSELSSRAECAPLPPASFADAQRLADGRDGRQRKEGKTKVPVKKVLAGPPDSSAFWLLSEVPPHLLQRVCYLHAQTACLLSTVALLPGHIRGVTASRC